jgi:hypothetical protein
MKYLKYLGSIYKFDLKSSIIEDAQIDPTLRIHLESGICLSISKRSKNLGYDHPIEIMCELLTLNMEIVDFLITSASFWDLDEYLNGRGTPENK